MIALVVQKKTQATYNLGYINLKEFLNSTN